MNPNFADSALAKVIWAVDCIDCSQTWPVRGTNHGKTLVWSPHSGRIRDFSKKPGSELSVGPRVGNTVGFPLQRALPTATKIERGMPQSKSGTSVA